MNYDGAKLRWANRRLHTAHVVFGEVLYAPGGSCGPRVQRDYELVVLRSGYGSVELNGRTVSLKPGIVYLFVPGGREHFQFAPAQETHHAYCSITPTALPEEVRRGLKTGPPSMPLSPVFDHLLSAAFKMRTLRNSAATRLINHLGLCLCLEFQRGAKEHATQGTCDQSVGMYLDYLEGHFSDPDCLARAHQAAGVSRNTLINRFQKEKQTTPARFLWRFRTERGVAMLVETGHSVGEVAYRCGFRTPFHFSRMVRQHTGRSPREVRRAAWSHAPGGSSES
jgi:AraC family transcriptional regulator of arabinose operon